ncbi:MAG TPA: alpha/beta hydrolase-fold protein [Tepidisphaeraceae bacterium]|nr:alpha/beta hydrolase-fold protein [Tepidisphaeraceae bacterium]
MKRKRRIAGAGGAVLIVALLGIFGWYVVHTRATQAELTRAVREYESRKPVSVTFEVSVPDGTPKDQVLYLSGSVPALGNWDAAGVPLARRDDGKYAATVPDLLNGMEYAFKVTRGTWGTVEADAQGKEVVNHAFTAAPDAKVAPQVAGWMDGGKAVPGRVTMTGNLVVHKNAFKSNALGNQRTLIVYLPPDYQQNADKRYPVLYLQDGQNLFDEATSYQGIEWGADEAAQRLIGAGRMEPVILVGVHNAGEFRLAEFTPPLAGTPADKAKADAYVRMLVEEVKPFIDQRYRTRSDRAGTYVGGGSLGGLLALYAAKTKNDVFGGVVALSPWLRLGDKPVIKELIGDGGWLKNTFAFIDVGTDGGHNYPGGGEHAVPDAQAFVAAAEQAGVAQGDRFIYREIEGHKHNESSWNATIEQVLLAVYGKDPATTAPTSSAVKND